MKALLCTHFGGPDDLEYADIPDPAAGQGEVVVAVHAAALNFFDTLIIAGKYQFKPPFPFSPASEFAGVVEKVGAGVTGLAAGDRVLGYGGFGAAREKIALSAQRVVKIPDTLDYDRAAGITVIYGTTLHALKDRAHLKSGETLAVLGAGGGVGLAAVELGKIAGATVIAAASSDEKLAAAREHGADVSINYGRVELRDALKEATGGRGVDVIYDPVGGRFAESALRSLAWRGRLLVVGFADGQIPQLPANLLLIKGTSAVGVFWGEFARREPRENARMLGELFAWLAEGKLKPHVSRAYPLRDTPQALEALLERRAVGKLVINPWS